MLKRRAYVWAISVVGLAGIAGALLLPRLLGAPRPKDPPAGPPMSAEEFRDALKEKGELTWANGTLRIKVKKVEGPDLLDVTLLTIKDGKVVSTLTAPVVQIPLVDRETGNMFIRCHNATMLREDWEATFAVQEWEIPAARKGNKP
jgi:hypothetical protein